MNKNIFASYLSLFTSMGTLLCCALPSFLVLLGAGAVFSSLISTVPQLIWISKYKIWVFSIAGAMLVITGILQYGAKGITCPLEKNKAIACGKSRKISIFIYWLSLVFYVLGFFAAFILPYII